jgi:hypothetical protein
MMTKVSEAQRRQRQEAPLKHGGAAAVISVQKGEPLRGLAELAERDVLLELENKGALALIQRNATRLQACVDLYWNAIMKAAQEGDLKSLDHYVSRFGWLAGASLRAWAQVRQEERLREPLDAGRVLDAIKEKKDE